jgi:hypothetical protein
MDGKIPFHFLLLGVGYMIKDYGYTSPERLQNYINNDPNFAIRPPLAECRLAIQLMEDAGFITRSTGGNWEQRYAG